MKKYFSISALLILCVLFTAGFSGKCSIKEFSRDYWNSIDPGKFNQKALELQLEQSKVKTVSPKGLTIFSRAALSSDSLNALEASLDINEAQAKQYFNQNINRGDFGVIVVKAEREISPDGLYLPVFAVPIRCPGDPYCGSIYDKGKMTVNGKTYSNLHYVYAAERVIGNKVWMVAEYNKNFVDMMFASSFGGEHEIEKQFDFLRYQQNAVHLNGGHPLMPLPPETIEEILTRNNVKRDVMALVSTRGFVPRVTPSCAPVPDGDDRKMCVVE